MIIYEDQEYHDVPRIRELIKRADAIQNDLTPVADGFVRLWRGNKNDEVGKNPIYTSSLVGIALPFLESYEGNLAYVDVPTQDLKKYIKKAEDWNSV